MVVPPAACPEAGVRGNGCHSPAAPTAPPAWAAQAHVPVLITAAAIKLSVEGGNLHHTAPAGGPLIMANAHHLHFFFFFCNIFSPWECSK